jgi:hypothetical protein
MNEYTEFLKILEGIKTCITDFDIKGALEMVEISKKLYNLKITDFELTEGPKK